MKKNIEQNKIILTLLSILFFLIFFKTFHNVYVLVRNDYAARLTNNYGYCDKQGYGFVSSTIIKNGIKDNINIINNLSGFAHIDSLFYKFDKSYNKNYVILLNYNNNNSVITLNNSKYEILDSYENKCFLLKKENG
jgi:hypothetical protein